MVTELQFAAVAAYLLWCLFSSLSGVLGGDPQDAESPQRFTKATKTTKSQPPGSAEVQHGRGGLKGVR
jgi:hypothetical protein